MFGLALYIYADESGVFDKKNNDVFVFGGLVFVDKRARDIESRKYSNAEKTIREINGYSREIELKATALENKHKNKLYRSLNSCYKFGGVVEQKRVLDKIFSNKKSKQRYLDYVFKIAIKNIFTYMLQNSIISAQETDHICFFVDEHSTSTDGCYELKEALEQEFKIGTFNYDYNKFYPPIFPNLKSLDLHFCNSKSKLLVRGADIVANRIYYMANNGGCKSDVSNKLIIKNFP